MVDKWRNLLENYKISREVELLEVGTTHLSQVVSSFHNFYFYFWEFLNFIIKTKLTLVICTQFVLL